jgi:acetamidase/formamidase
MDYNRLTEGVTLYLPLTEGVTLYLPVSQPGALLFVGDGHAAQGDGELTGNALETSMDIEFAVDVMPGKSPGMPRAEDDQ